MKIIKRLLYSIHCKGIERWIGSGWLKDRWSGQKDCFRLSEDGSINYYRISPHIMILSYACKSRT